MSNRLRRGQPRPNYANDSDSDDATTDAADDVDATAAGVGAVEEGIDKMVLCSVNDDDDDKNLTIVKAKKKNTNRRRPGNTSPKGMTFGEKRRQSILRSPHEMRYLNQVRKDHVNRYNVWLEREPIIECDSEPDYGTPEYIAWNLEQPELPGGSEYTAAEIASAEAAIAAAAVVRPGKDRRPRELPTAAAKLPTAAVKLSTAAATILKADDVDATDTKIPIAQSEEVNTAYKTVIKEVFDDHMKYNNRTVYQQKQWMAYQRSHQKFGWQNSHTEIFLGEKTLYELVRNHPVVEAVHNKHPNHRFPKSLWRWWGNQIGAVIGTKSCQTGKQTPTSIPIGGVLSGNRDKKAGNALVSEQKRYGLYMKFERKFGETTLQVLNIIEAYQTDGKTIAYEPKYGGYGEFNHEQAEELSLKRTNESLQLLATKYHTTIRAVLGGRTLPAFIRTYKDDLKQLEKDCRSHSDNSVDIMAFDFADQDEVNHYKRNKPNVIFCALANILVCYHDIINGLLNKKICIVVDNKERLHFMTKIDKAMKVEMCIGSLVKSAKNPNDFADEVTSDGYYLIELYTVAEERNDFLFIDTNCRANANYTSETTNALYRAIPYLGYESRTVRLCMITHDKSGGVTSWKYRIRDSDEEQRTHDRINTLHRLVNIVANHNGFGFNNYTPLREYLQLKEGETITSIERFQYHDFTNKRSARLITRRLTKLQHKEWVNVKLASICDIDHMIGRSELWMNSNFFTWKVSHQYNNQLSFVRVFFGDWLYGFSGEIEYLSGND